MRSQSFGVTLFVALALASLLLPSCDYYDSPESQLYSNGTFSDNFDWDFQRTARLEFSMAESARPEWGRARFEVRHTVYGEPLLFRGTLSDQSSWTRAISVRLPQHETALSVTVETQNGLIRHIVPINDDGYARAEFE